MMYSGFETLAECLSANYEYVRSGGAKGRWADLRNADLSNADLSNADLRNADLSDADLSNADLSNANLRDADLRNANLRNADLSNADLCHADLGNANLRDADLSNANLSGATLPAGYKWEIYLAEVVPALLTAGGRSLDDVVAKAWDCHEWENCPIAVAFDVTGLSKVPRLYRREAEQFVQFFDAKLIPKPAVAA